MEWYDVVFILAISVATPLIAHKLHWGTWFDDPLSDPYDTMEDWRKRNGLGAITGSILGVGAAVIAEVLELPLTVVKAAKEAGCETYEEIREFAKEFKDD